MVTAWVGTFTVWKTASPLRSIVRVATPLHALATLQIPTESAKASGLPEQLDVAAHVAGLAGKARVAVAVQLLVAMHCPLETDAAAMGEPVQLVVLAHVPEI